MKMRVSYNKALALIEQIPHETCRGAAAEHWQPGGTFGVTPQSICWLHCWARTGMGSAAAAAEATNVFNRVFDESSDWFAQRVPHETARDLRYATGDVEDQLSARLSR